MNLVLPEQFDERIDRLARGLEPIDVLRSERIAAPIEIARDGAPGAASGPFADPIGPLRRITRHSSCRYVVLYRPGMKTKINLRFFDPHRRFVPRRISYTIPANINTPSPRVRRPAFFPGAGYDVSQTATGMRGRVTWKQSNSNEIPARWVRVEASVNGQIVGRAHGDDRGEFLLILDCTAGGQGELPNPLDVLVTVFGPPAVKPIPKDDPIGDLPLEVLTGDPDDVSPGVKRPPQYAATAHSSRSVTFEFGTILTGQPKFFFNP
jgi:hypothetical protein